MRTISILKELFWRRGKNSMKMYMLRKINSLKNITGEQPKITLMKKKINNFKTVRCRD